MKVERAKKKENFIKNAQEIMMAIYELVQLLGCVGTHLRWEKRLALAIHITMHAPCNLFTPIPL